MPLRIVKRHGSPNYYIRGTVRGVSVDESTGVADREHAEAFRVKREWQITQGELTGRRAVASFIEAAISYVEAGGEGRYVHALIDYFGTKPLSEIGQPEVEQAIKVLGWKRKGKKGGLTKCGPATINRRIFTPVSAVMRHAALLGMCEAKLFKRPEPPKGRIRWLTSDEADLLIAHCAEHIAPIVIFMLYTGARIGEALTLDWHEVDLTRAHVAFLDTKNGEDRGVPLHPRVIVALANLKHRKGRVFLTDDGLPYRNSDAGGGQIKTAFNAACRRAKIVKFRVHDCRHTWATWHYAANRDLLKLSELGGWKTLSMVKRYAHVNTSHLADSILALPGGNPGSIVLIKSKNTVKSA